MIVIATILTCIYYLNVGLIFLIFHPIQWVCLKVFGYEAHKRSVDLLNYLSVKNFAVIGAKVKIEGLENLPKDGSLIIISNHQSMWDISPLGWTFRKFHPKYISKKELGKGIPSVSFNLKHGGSVLIDRDNGGQSIRAVIELGKNVEKKGYSACIFAEGTRSKTGKMRKFQASGVKTLLKVAPSAHVMPFSIDGNYKLQLKGFALPLGVNLTYTVLPEIDRVGKKPEEIVEEAEQSIRKSLGQLEEA